MVCDFPSFPKKNGKSPKEENAAPSLRPENFAGHYPPRNSLALLAQTGAPADATGGIFSLRAPASVQRGGDAGPMLDLLPIRCGLHFRCVRFAYTGIGSHRDDCRSLHARGSFVSRAGTLPCDSVKSHAGADPHTIKIFQTICEGQSANVSPHTHARSAADRARLCRAFFFPIRRRKAPRKCPAQPDSSFPLRPCAARRKKSACGHFVPCGREYSFPPSPEPGLEAGQFQRGGFFICAALPLRRSSPERRV